MVLDEVSNHKSPVLGDAGAPDEDTYWPVKEAREDAALLADVLASDAFVFAVEALDAIQQVR